MKSKVELGQIVHLLQTLLGIYRHKKTERIKVRFLIIVFN